MPTITIDSSVTKLDFNEETAFLKNKKTFVPFSFTGQRLSLENVVPHANSAHTFVARTDDGTKVNLVTRYSEGYNLGTLSSMITRKGNNLIVKTPHEAFLNINDKSNMVCYFVYKVPTASGQPVREIHCLNKEQTKALLRMER